MEPDWTVIVDEGWRHSDDASALVDYFTRIYARHPESPRAMFELANALDYCGQEAAAVPYYENAIRHGLSREFRRYALMQLGSSLRNVGRPVDAVQLLTTAEQEYPDSWAASLFLALSLNSAGRPQDALKTALRAILKHGRGEDLERYRHALANYIEEIV